MNLEQQLIEIQRRAHEKPSYVVCDDVNNVYYLCYPKQDFVADTDFAWKIIKIALVGTDWQRSLYKTQEYKYQINNGTTRLATLTGYATGWINYNFF